jgi:hypothetical protein
MSAPDGTDSTIMTMPLHHLDATIKVGSVVKSDVHFDTFDTFDTEFDL